MTQCQLESISFKILKEHTETDLEQQNEESELTSFTHDLNPFSLKEYTETNLDSDKDESTICSFVHDLEPKKEVNKKNADEKEHNLIRKVEMNLDSETDLHIYENKYKIIVRKQVPFYMTKKTWKLLLSKHETINTASKLTEF